MSRRLLVTFFIVQIVGELCSWAGPHVLSWPGPFMWAAGAVLLLPGRLLSTVLVEELLWGRYTLTQMSLVEGVTDLIVNFAFWFACARAWCFFSASRANR